MNIGRTQLLMMVWAVTVVIGVLVVLQQWIAALVIAIVYGLMLYRIRYGGYWPLQ